MRFKCRLSRFKKENMALTVFFITVALFSEAKNISCPHFPLPSFWWTLILVSSVFRKLFLNWAGFSWQFSDSLILPVHQCYQLFASCRKSSEFRFMKPSPHWGLWPPPPPEDSWLVWILWRSFSPKRKELGLLVSHFLSLRKTQIVGLVHS